MSERDVALARFMRAVNGTEPGTRLFWIDGDPRSGKSELLAELAKIARASGWQIADGSADVLEPTPFVVLAEAIEKILPLQREDLIREFPAHHLRLLASIFPTLVQYAPEPTTPESPSEKWHAFHAITRLLSRISSTNRLLLIVDDMHWADDASVQLFEYLVRHQPDGVLIAAATRPRQSSLDLRAILERASAGGYTAHVTLPPLADDKAHSSSPPAGNANSGTLPYKEFRVLPPSARIVAEAATMIDEPFDVELLSEVTQLDEQQVRSGIDELVRHVILRVDDNGRQFRYHDSLMRAAASDMVGAAWRLGAHARAAKVLRRRDAPPARVARHLAHSGVAADDSTIGILVDAARAVRWEKPSDTVAWLRAALDLGNQPPGHGEPEQLSMLGAALVITGQLAEGRVVLGHLPSCDEQAFWMASVLRLIGKHREAENLLQRRLGAAPARGRRMRVRLAAALLATSMEIGEATTRVRSDVLKDLDSPDDAVLRLLLLALNATRSARVSEESDDTILEARELVARLTDEALAPQLDALYWLACAEQGLDRDDLARAHLERALALAGRFEQRFLVPSVAIRLASLLLDQSDWDSGERLAAHALQGAQRIGSEFLVSRAADLLARISSARQTRRPVVVAPADERPDAVLARHASPDLETLSRRENEIAWLVSGGRTNQQIARTLELSHRTVETYLARIFKKLDICSRAQLATIVGRVDGNSRNRGHDNMVTQMGRSAFVAAGTKVELSPLGNSVATAV